ncbi:hypothetical protein LCGC14_2692090 [marine sediment metagenome]|uniref:Uncharacterized protein n=1 Tax=marine sediment metagenome TaxID=412755 RepID=A0A0F8ZI88_9ZZZZ
MTSGALSRPWRLGLGDASYLLPDEKELYTLLRQRVSYINRQGHSEAVLGGRVLLERLVAARRARTLRNALESHHQLIALSSCDEECRWQRSN